tara:strand:+ start:6421 stop:6654 length:234 start_codon:yes stop_codon:yes gene_type:complete
MDICNDISRTLNELIINIAWYLDELVNVNDINETKEEINNLLKKERNSERRIEIYKYEDERMEGCGNEDWIDEWDKV